MPWGDFRGMRGKSHEGSRKWVVDPPEIEARIDRTTIESANCLCLYNRKRHSFLRRHLIPRSAFEFSAGLFLVEAAPLFEEKCDALFKTLIANFSNPGCVHWSRARAGLTAGDCPIDPF